MLKIGIVGCGSIGAYLAKEITQRYKKQVKFAGIYDIDRKKIDDLSSSLKIKMRSYPSLDTLARGCDLLIEAASVRISAEVVEKALALGKDVMVMSVGGLLGRLELLEKVKRSKIKLYIPSGAIAGLDGLKSAGMGKISKVILTTQKPVESLEGAPYFEAKKIDLNKIKKEEVIFSGNALEAIAGFPMNINVAAVLSLAGLGAKKTLVRIVASRRTKKNTHTIEIEGDFGKIVTCAENVPSEVNLKTSKLAMLAALATLDGILNNIRIGT